MTDAPKPLTEEELARLERWIRGVLESRPHSFALVAWSADELRRLVAEVRRLRQLVIDAGP